MARGGDPLQGNAYLSSCVWEGLAHPISLRTVLDHQLWTERRRTGISQAKGSTLFDLASYGFLVHAVCQAAFGAGEPLCVLRILNINSVA